MHGLGASHPKDAIGGLKGGSFNISPLGELLPSKSLGCPSSGGWWSNQLGT
jgi:hypothetical protein